MINWKLGEVDMCADEDMTEVVLSLRRDKMWRRGARKQGSGHELVIQYSYEGAGCERHEAVGTATMRTWARGKQASILPCVVSCTRRRPCSSS